MTDIRATLDKIAPAVEQLACHQQQADADGVMVTVSRQAVDEVVNAINDIAISLSTSQGDAPVAWIIHFTNFDEVTCDAKIAAHWRKFYPDRKITECFAGPQHAPAFGEGVDAAIKVATEMRDKWSSPTGDKYTEGMWDQSQRIIGKLKVLLDEQALSTLRAPDAGESEMFRWYDGAPPKPWAKEWFIAETTFRDRVVLKALPEDWTYDFKTADDTYIKADKIKRWMQFPDSEFIAPAAPAPSEARLREALEHVRAIISDGALTGFNCRDGDWAERLFASQALTLKALTASGGSDRCPMREKYETAAQTATSAVGRGDGPMPHGPATGDGQPVAAVGSNPATATNRPLDPREIVARIIHTYVGSKSDPNFVERRWLTGVDDAADAIIAALDGGPRCVG